MLIESAIKKTRDNPSLLFTHKGWIKSQAFTAFNISDGKVFKYFIYNLPANESLLSSEPYTETFAAFMAVSGEEFASKDWTIIDLPERAPVTIPKKKD